MEELDLKELFTIFWSRKLVILLITLLVVMIGVIHSYFFIVPKYKSSTKLVLAQNSPVLQEGQREITQMDVTLNANLVNTYSEIIKSSVILQEVIDDLEMKELTLSGIKEDVSVEIVKGTEVIQITVKNMDPNLAAKIANKIAEISTEKIIEIYNISNIYILDKAEPSGVPYNINHTKDIVVFVFIGIVIAVGYVLISNLFDTTIKTEHDIENLTGLLVLSSIPNYEEETKKKKRGKRL